MPVKDGVNNSSLNGKDRKPKHETSLQLKFRANRFLRVHLQVLKALYEQQTQPESTPDGRHLEKKHWDVIESFLKERGAIKGTMKRTQRMREIHEEAMEFQKSVSASSVVENRIVTHPFSPQLTRIGNRKREFTALTLITQPSPRSLPKRSSHAWAGIGSKSGGRRNSNRNINMFYNMHSDSAENDRGNAFGMVSGLLKRKYNLASRRLTQRTVKLRALVKECQHRIEILDSQLVVEKKNKDFLSGRAVNMMHSFEEHEDALVRIETKIGLWKLLLQDLSGTISEKRIPIYKINL